MIQEIINGINQIVQTLGVIGMFLGAVLIVAVVVISLFGMQTLLKITERLIK